MSDWDRVDHYLEDVLLPEDLVLDAVLAANREAGLPAIDVSPLQGRLLYLLAKAVGPGRILEIGTLGGYSTIWLARALPAAGRLVTLEVEARHAEIAGRNLERADLAGLVEIRVGPAAESLAALESEGEEPFDLVFIDADKGGYPVYVDWAVRLGRPGTLVVLDNVVRRGRIVDPEGDPSALGARAALELIGRHPRLEGTAVQTVGVKGHDGLAVAVVR